MIELFIQHTVNFEKLPKWNEFEVFFIWRRWILALDDVLSLVFKNNENRIEINYEDDLLACNLSNIILEPLLILFDLFSIEYFKQVRF